MARPREPERLDPRARQLLRTLIGRYIRDGEPVGSQTLARHAGLDVSPATIRNILADLEGAGLLAAPHASAGRVPTAQGYRVFVDSLLQLKPLGEGELQHLRQDHVQRIGTLAAAEHEQTQTPVTAGQAGGGRRQRGDRTAHRIAHPFAACAEHAGETREDASRQA